MKVCPNRECPFLEEYGEMAEYRDEIAHCVDCGAPLVYRSQAPILPSVDEENEEEMEAEELVVIGAFDHPEKAHIYRAHLEAIGIPAFLFDEHMMTNNRLMTSALGGVRLAVPESAVETALTVLADPDLATDEQGDDEEVEGTDDDNWEEETEEEIDQPMQPTNCLRCQGEMKYLKEYKFESQDNNRGLLGALFDIEERLVFDVYVCTSCRHTEFFFTGSSKKWDG